MPRKPKRGRSGRKYPRRAKWFPARDACMERAGVICEISGEDLLILKHGEDCTGNQCDSFDDGYCKEVWRRAVDHLLPEKWVRRFCKGANPHVPENLFCISTSLHASKTAIEYLIFRGDAVGYQNELVRLGWSREHFQNAMRAINQSVRKDAPATRA